MQNNISELKILHSRAGFYIGREWFENKYPSGPYSRNSMYFPTKEEAIEAFKDGNYCEDDNVY